MPLSPDGHRTTDEETRAVCTWILSRKRDRKIGGKLGNRKKNPLFCRFRAEKTTPNKKKDRWTALAFKRTITHRTRARGYTILHSHHPPLRARRISSVHARNRFWYPDSQQRRFFLLFLVLQNAFRTEHLSTISADLEQGISARIPRSYRIDPTNRVQVAAPCCRYRTKVGNIGKHLTRQKICKDIWTSEKTAYNTNPGHRYRSRKRAKLYKLSCQAQYPRTPP